MLINYKKLQDQKEELNQKWNNQKPFRYLVIDDFLLEEKAEALHDAYPKVEDAAWENTTYINQKNKFVKTNFEDAPVLAEIFDELNGQSFRDILSGITSIDGILADENLFGAGLHQSINGAFLDVHVDFNIHPETNYHRRMNLLIYMNKDWKESYNGYLELWDMSEKKQIENVSPKFNRAVIFETNEISYHGHPKKLNTPKGVTRKSISVYYYTETRPKNEIADSHNTIYANTQGMSGTIKNIKSGVKASIERLLGK
ncbi:MAG: 2OG-Fe(II) oxygenase [Bacteroidota bacterium]